MQLRDVEKAKIACARKHFELIEKENPKIHYDVVNSYDELISLLNDSEIETGGNFIEQII